MYNLIIQEIPIVTDKKNFQSQKSDRVAKMKDFLSSDNLIERR